MEQTTRKKVYLAHPYLAREYGEELQKRIESLGIEVVNPFHCGEQEIYDKAFKEGRELTEAECEQIVKGDLRQIVKSSAVVAIVDGTPSIGTYMEIFYASYYLWKKVFCLYTVKKGFKHPWISHLCNVSLNETHLLTKLEEWRTCN